MTMLRQELVCSFTFGSQDDAETHHVRPFENRDMAPGITSS